MVGGDWQKDTKGHNPVIADLYAYFSYCFTAFRFDVLFTHTDAYILI